MHTSHLLPGPVRHCMIALLFAAIVLLATNEASARGAEGSQYSSYGQYGEVTRFGSFDSTWFDEGQYDGKGGTPAETEPKPGLFVDPVGFAVDTDDEGTGQSAVYVLDRVSGVASVAGPNGTEWRLQKLSTTGSVLGVSEFYLPKNTVASAKYQVYVGVVGLAVDDSTGAVYTVLYDSSGTGASTTREVDEVLEWSTTPSSGKLVAPNGATLDTVSKPVSGYTVPGVLSTAAQLQSTPLYEPQGIADDGSSDVAVEGDGSVRSSSGAVQGPAVVDEISTASGAVGSTWSAATLTAAVKNASSEDAGALAAGISSDPGGALNVLLSTTEGTKFGVLDDVQLSSSLSGPTVLDSSDLDPIARVDGHSYPSAAEPDNPDPIAVANPGGKLGPGGGKGASAQVVQLSNGLYGADFSSEPTVQGGLWDGPANEGVRLVEPEAEGLLTNPSAPVTSVFDTLGGPSAGTPCAIGDGGVAEASNGLTLAAGANGAVWALTAGRESSEYEPEEGEPDAPYVTGRQVIELAPGGAGKCVGPSGTFSFEKEGGSPQPATSPLTVPVGSTVDFNASSIEYPAKGKLAGVYAYEWDPELGAAHDPGYSLADDTVPATDFAPEQSTASYQYTSAGVYTIGLKLLGDFGEYDETATLTVQTTGLPTAFFTAPSEAHTGEAVTVNAEESKPASGGSIAAYEWKFGDGGSDESQSPIDTHVYEKTGTDTITLVVKDDDNQKSTAVTRQITITSPPVTTTTTTSQTSSTQTATTTTKTTTSKTSSKPLTTAQKLAAALKLCKKDKAKKKRAACEKAAKKKYQVKKPAKKKAKAKKKKKK